MADRPPSRLVPVLTLAGVLLLGLIAYWAFPALQRHLARQDCIALARTNC